MSMGKVHQYKHIFIDCLSIFSDSSPRLQEWIEQQIKEKDFERYTIYDYFIIFDIYHILVLLEEKTDIHQPNNCNVENHKIKILNIIQKLLSSSSQPDFVEGFYMTDKEKGRHLVLGIILGNY